MSAPSTPVLEGIGARLQDIPELLKEVFETPFTESVPRDNYMLQRFSRQNAKRDVVQWKIHYAGNTSAGSYGELDEAPDAGIQKYKEAEVPIRQNWVIYGTTGLAAAATKSQQGAWFQTLASEAKEALEDLKDELNNQILAMTKAKPQDIDGVGVIVSDTGTYAGIDRSTNLWWRSYVNRTDEVDEEDNPVPRPLTLELMFDQLEQLEKKDRRAKTSAIFTSRAHYNDYFFLLSDQRRYVNVMKLDGGVEALDFNSIPVISVLGIPHGNMFFLDESEWGYYVLENFETVQLPVNGDAQKFFTKHYSQLVCKHPGRQGLITDLA